MIVKLNILHKKQIDFLAPKPQETSHIYIYIYKLHNKHEL